MKYCIPKRVFCMFLTLIMLVSLFPAAVFADEDYEDELQVLEEYGWQDEFPVEASESYDESEWFTDELEEVAEFTDEAEADVEPAEIEEIDDEIPMEVIIDDEEYAGETDEIIEEPVIVTDDSIEPADETDEEILLPDESADIPEDAEIGKPADEEDSEKNDEKAEKAEKADKKEKENSGPFPGLPEGYELSEEQISMRTAMAEHCVSAELAELTPDVDYIDGEVWFLADDEDYARIVAEAYGAELVSFDYGVGILRLKETTVVEAIAAAEDPELNLPPVSPDYIVNIGPQPVETESEKNADALISNYSFSRRNWEYWRDLYGKKFDFFLRDPSASAEPGSATQLHYQYMHDMINTYDAWGVTRGSGITVAVLDTGVAKHEDLPTIRRIVVDSSIDQGDNPGNPNDSDDVANHGTHVGGIVGARLGNGVGGAGIAPEATIMSIQISNGNGMSDANIAKAVRAAYRNGADIINMSFGGKFWDANEELVMKEALNAGVTLVCSSGNDNANVMNYPGTFDLPGLICVGAATRGGARAGYSNFGSWVDVLAPGSDIWSTAAGNHYVSWNGTSMATPVVAGACALYMACYGHTDPVTMEKVIKASVTNGVLDVSKFFEKDTASPEIHVQGLEKNTAPYGAKLTFVTRPGDTILYTLDGSTPGLKDGSPAPGSLVYSGACYLNADSGITVGKKITIKAARVTGLGLVSKASTLSLTVGYASPTSVSITNVSSKLVAGKSITPTAVVNPANAADQTVSWSIVSQPSAPGATINSKTGQLTTKATDSGKIQIRATSTAAPAKYKNYTITLSNVLPTQKVILSTSKGGAPVSKLTLAVGLNNESATLYAKALTKEEQTVSTTFAWKSSNPQVAEVNNSGVITAVSKGTATISCTALDGSNISAKCNVTVVQLAEELQITGPAAASNGKSITFKAAVLPNTANSKTVSWSIDSSAAAAGASIKNGSLTIPQSFSRGSITVTAQTTDGSGLKATHVVKITPTVGKVSIYLNSSPKFYGGGKNLNKDGTLKDITLYSVEQNYWQGASKNWVDSYARLTTKFDVSSSAAVIWSSSNENVVTVSDDGYIYAVGSGTAKVTAKVNDAGGKSSSVSVKVIIPVSSVTVVSSIPALNSDSDFYGNMEFDRILGVGKTANNKVVLGDAFGKPTNGKVAWSFTVSAFNSSGSEVSWLESTIVNNNLVKLSSSGALSTTSGLSNYLKNYDIFVTVTAEAVGDNSHVTGSCTYWITPLTTKIGVASKLGYDGDVYVLQLGAVTGSWWWPDFNVTSSNPKAGTAMIKGKNLYLIPNNEELPTDGKVVYSTIKVTAADGSGKSMSLKIGFWSKNHDTYYSGVVLPSKLPWI